MKFLFCFKFSEKGSILSTICMLFRVMSLFETPVGHQNFRVPQIYNAHGFVDFEHNKIEDSVLNDDVIKWYGKSYKIFSTNKNCLSFIITRVVWKLLVMNKNNLIMSWCG